MYKQEDLLWAIVFSEVYKYESSGYTTSATYSTAAVVTTSLPYTASVAYLVGKFSDNKVWGFKIIDSNTGQMDSFISSMDGFRVNLSSMRFATEEESKWLVNSLLAGRVL